MAICARDGCGHPDTNHVSGTGPCDQYDGCTAFLAADVPDAPDPILSLGDGLLEPGRVRDYVRVSAVAVPDEDLDRMYGAAIRVQSRICTDTDDPPTWPAPLVQAVLRRVQRSIASKALPLGVLDAAAEYGPARIPLYDALIEDLEISFRRVVVA